MFRKVPIANKLVYNRIKERDNEIHENKLKTVSSKLDQKVLGQCTNTLGAYNKKKY